MGRVLFLEDDDAIAMAIEFNLDDEGFIVDRVASVSEAKTIFKTKEYDIAILDVMLGDGSGYDVCKYIREESDIPIIFLTACDDEVNIILGLEIGADDYITKPFRAKELVTRMRANLRRYSKGTSLKGILKCEDLTVNLNTSTLSINGDNILLTAQEYKLILAFLDNPLNVLSKEQLLDRIYDFDSTLIDDKTLAVYIRRLREKIEKKSNEPEYIITKRGLGYMWGKSVIRR